MRIITLNTWQERGPWRERWELIFRGLREYDADIAGFQEVFNMEWAEEIRRRSGYPYLAVSGEHSGLIFLSKFKPVEQACLTLNTKSPAEDYLRYVFYLAADVEGEKVAFFNTHLSWRADENEVRMKQMLELEAFVKEKAPGLPAALLGDLNCASNTPPVVYLREIRKWIDTFWTKNPGELGLTWDYRNPYAEAEREKMAERRIDYIFIRERTGPFEKICSSKVVFNEPANTGPGGQAPFDKSQKGASPRGIWPSDHFGVMTEFVSDKS